jgi:nucleoside-diphosphate-sugar epimerase
LIFTSSTGVYAQDGGEWVDESSPAEPRHFSGRRMLEGERLLRGSRFESTVVRLAGIYGPGRCRLIERVRSGQASIPPSAVYANRIHRDDCAAVLHHLMRLERAAPLYVAADEEPAETAEVLRWLAARLRVPEPPIDREAGATRYGRSSNKRVRSTGLRTSVYRFLFPTFREGYGAIIDAGEPVSG